LFRRLCSRRRHTHARARAVVVAPRLGVHARESRASGTTTHRDDDIALETDDDDASRAREVSSSDARGNGGRDRVPPYL